MRLTIIAAAIAAVLAGCAVFPPRVEAAPAPAPVAKTVKAPELAAPLEAPAPAAVPAYVAPAISAAPVAPAPIVNVAPAQVNVPAPVVTVSPAPETSIVIRWGEWLVSVLTFLGGFALVLRRLAFGLIKNPVVRMAAEAYFTETKVRELVNVAIAKTAGATKDRAVSWDVGSKIAADVGNAALVTMPGLVVDLLGGEEGIREKAISILKLEEAGQPLAAS